MNGHSYRTFGYLVGMLLVRSFDRSERVLAAMKCRGFRGQYWLLDHFSFVASPRRAVLRGDVAAGYGIAGDGVDYTVGWASEPVLKPDGLGSPSYPTP